MKRKAVLIKDFTEEIAPKRIRLLMILVAHGRPIRGGKAHLSEVRWR
jgi:hypothetical protein